MELLRELDSGEGVSYDSLYSNLKDASKKELNSALENLLYEGDIFEPKVKHYSLVLY